MSLPVETEVSISAVIGRGTRIWPLSQVREGVILGEDCTIGRGCYIGPGVRIGRRVKIQNLAQIYDPAIVEDGAFIGPAVVLTNDPYPRSVTPDGQLMGAGHWTPVGVTVQEGASIGARSVCVAPAIIGRWALVGAGSVVVRDVPDFAMVVGNPARQIGWAGRVGRRLEKIGDAQWRCPVTGTLHIEENGSLREASE